MISMAIFPHPALTKGHKRIPEAFRILKRAMDDECLVAESQVMVRWTALM